MELFFKLVGWSVGSVQWSEFQEIEKHQFLNCKSPFDFTCECICLLFNCFFLGLKAVSYQYAAADEYDID